MTLQGEVPHPLEKDRLLSDEEIRQFGFAVVWPAIENLSGIDFLNVAVAGEDFRYYKTMITPEGKLRVRISAECWDESDAEDSFMDSGETVYAAHLGIEKLNADIRKGLFIAAGLDASIYDIDELSQIEAWEVEDYRFITCSDPEIAYSSDKSFELQDEDGDILWTSADVFSDDSEAVGADPEKLDEIEKQFTKSILSSSQHEEITDVLVAVGVPKDKIQFLHRN